MPFLAYLSVDSVGRVVDAHILTDQGDPFPRKDDSLGYRFLGVYPTMNAAGEACADAFMKRTVVRDGVTYWRKRSPINKLAVIHSSKEKYLVTFHRNGELFSYEPSKPSIDRLNRVMKNMTPASIDVKFYAGVMITYQA